MDIVRFYLVLSLNFFHKWLKPEVLKMKGISKPEARKKRIENHIFARRHLASY